MCKLIVDYLAERTAGFEVFEGFSLTTYADGKVPNLKRNGRLLKTFQGSRKSF